jgi:uncharacterized membrane protein
MDVPGPNNPIPNLPSDPVRWWPTGIFDPQAWAVIGSAVVTYKVLHASTPRLRILGALTASGASAATIGVTETIENSIGFNRFIYGWTEYNRTGAWPSIDHVGRTVPSKTVKETVEFVAKMWEEAN